jgi:YhcH/YjgK/YiaL family protein
MILDKIGNRSRYRSLGSGIERALDYLAETDFSALQDGVQQSDVEEIVAIIATYDTEPESARRFEAHRRCIDVQYILAGREIIYWSPTAELTPECDYSDEKDVVFLSGDVRARLQLTPGSFVLFYPEDAHKPNCAWNDPARVRKVVVKVRTD